MTAEIIVLPVVHVERAGRPPADRCDLAHVVPFPRWLAETRAVPARRSLTSLLNEPEPA